MRFTRSEFRVHNWWNWFVLCVSAPLLIYSLLLLRCRRSRRRCCCWWWLCNYFSCYNEVGVDCQLFISTFPIRQTDKLDCLSLTIFHYFIVFPTQKPRPIVSHRSPVLTIDCIPLTNTRTYFCEVFNQTIARRAAVRVDLYWKLSLVQTYCYSFALFAILFFLIDYWSLSCWSVL